MSVIRLNKRCQDYKIEVKGNHAGVHWPLDHSHRNIKILCSIHISL